MKRLRHHSDMDQKNTMAGLLLPLIVLSATGLLLSITTHVVSLLGLTVPGGALVWSLHIGIFVVWLPAALVVQRINQGRPQSELWKNVLSGCPAWMRYAVYGLFAYAVANFIWFYAISRSVPEPEGDAPASVIRGFSGHWMMFYGAACAILVSTYLKPGLLKKRRCANGHDVSSTDVFCPTCGSEITRATNG